MEGQGQIFPKIGKKKLNNWPNLGCYFTYRLQFWYQGKIDSDAFNDPCADGFDHRSR